jgi:hypothetical protein
MIREVKEELSLIVSKLNYIASFSNLYNYKGISYYVVDAAFICEVEQLDMIMLKDDVASAMFIPLDKLDLD